MDAIFGIFGPLLGLMLVPISFAIRIVSIAFAWVAAVAAWFSGRISAIAQWVWEIAEIMMTTD